MLPSTFAHLIQALAKCPIFQAQKAGVWVVTNAEGETMTHSDPCDVLFQGAREWNAWRERNPGPVHFARPHWYDCPGPGGLQVKGHNRLDFSGMNLSGLSIHSAFAEGLHLQNSVFTDSSFEEGDFSRANFSGAVFRNTKFNKTILTGANFDGAKFINCNLNRVNLVGASFRVEEITETVVYGIAAWDLQTSDDMNQARLVIEKTYDLYSDIVANGRIPLMADNIELAQFIYYLSNHRKMRDVLNIFNAKGILLLGQFKDGGIDRLYRLHDWLKERKLMPMIFDFQRPDNMDLTETVVTMAGLSKLIIADVEGDSVPQELHAALSSFQKPVIAYSRTGPYSMYKDLKRKNPYAFDFEYGSEEDLFAKMEEFLAKADQGYAQIIRDLAEAYN